ncbi:MAG: type II secretion system F family protein [Kiritimatiellae bacterium]|nr:type II secretion system F family protein [Kiritimatiellia bacterium]
MTPLIIAILFGCMVAGAVYRLLSGINFNAAWQPETSPLARYLNARRRARFNEQLPDALATMNNALRAGLSINQSFESVVENGESPLADEFKILLQSLKIGMTMEEALEATNERVGSEDFSLVCTAILISRKTGGNVTEIFDKISDTIRGRMKIERKVRTLTAQGRLQGIIVSLMPVFLGVAMTLLKPEMMLPFLFSPIGVAAVLAMVALIVLGWLMIRKIIRIDV